MLLLNFFEYRVQCQQIPIPNVRAYIFMITHLNQFVYLILVYNPISIAYSLILLQIMPIK